VHRKVHGITKGLRARSPESFGFKHFRQVGAAGFEPTTSRPPDKRHAVASEDLSEVTSSEPAACTAACTSRAENANADALAAFVASLTPERRQRLAALLTGQSEGGQP